jgi:hypothetical protein
MCVALTAATHACADAADRLAWPFEPLNTTVRVDAKAGVIGVVLAPVVAAVGTMVAQLQNCTIHVERVRSQPGETSAATVSE